MTPQLSVKDNIKLAEQSLPSLIYSCSLIENIPVTKSQVSTLLQGHSVSGMRVDDLQKVLNLIYAWRYMLNNIHTPLDLTFMKNINRYVAYNESIEWGVLRTGRVGITGTTFKPPIPQEEKVNDQIKKYRSTNDIEVAISYTLWFMKAQLFWDGNKRTGLICLNKYLLSHGLGILSLSSKQIYKFNKHLSFYYQTDSNHEIKDLLLNCISLTTV
ncbi:Fic family protein [Halobacillus sp. Cin3]|uniref:Fic family protein n=1 Tax=Halobacillus sp. Cin3 TaxID=2928441 RepID=UPI00248DA744|nr:Fic family protein [Halobacillus sp. Cin3]